MLKNMAQWFFILLAITTMIPAVLLIILLAAVVIVSAVFWRVSHQISQSRKGALRRVAL